MIKLHLPTSDEEIRKLRVGDQVMLNGTMITARDAAHHYMVETFIRQEVPDGERETYEKLKNVLSGSVIYHCGPVVKEEGGKYRFVAAGPTTSSREEPYEHLIIREFNVKGIIGKGGMGPKTLEACQKYSAVYFHAVGGAATFTAQAVREVLDVYKLDLGVPEAMWVIRVEDFPVVVTMDAHGDSLHAKVARESQDNLDDLLASF